MPHRSGSAIARRATCSILLILALGLSVNGAIHMIAPSLVTGPKSYTFFDLDVLLDKLGMLRDTGILYETTRPDYFLPGTEVFKYPPPAAALILLTVDRHPQVDQETGETTRKARPLVLLSLIGLAAAVAIVLWTLRPSIPRTALILIVVMTWLPLWETLAGPQSELLILFLAALSWLGAHRGSKALSGVPLGIAGCLKVYPWLLGAGLLTRRSWRGILWIAIGAIGTFVASAAYLGWDLTRQYLTQILPRQGGTALGVENLSLLGNLSRWTYAMFGRPGGIESKSTGLAALLTHPAASGAPVLAWLVAIPVIALLIGALIRQLRRPGSAASRERDGVFLCAVMTVALFVLPTSWANYQALLLLPMIVAIGHAAPWSEDRWTWCLLGVTALCVMVTTDDVIRAVQVNSSRDLIGSIHGVPSARRIQMFLRRDWVQTSFTITRSLVPLLLWSAYWRLLRLPAAESVLEPAGASDDGSADVPLLVAGAPLPAQVASTSSREPERLQIILPVHNEAGSIASVVEGIHAALSGPVSVEFILSEDGSTDGTPEILRELATRFPAIVLTDPKRKGYARAVLDAFTRVDTPYVLFMDSDGQYDPHDFWRLFARRDGADVVSGWRKRRCDTAVRRAMSRCFGLLHRALFGFRIHDPSSSFVLMRTDRIRPLLPELGGMREGFWWEFTARAIQHGLRIEEVPVSHLPRSAGATRVYNPSAIPRIAWRNSMGLIAVWRSRRST